MDYFTKEQRNNIYRIALERHLENIEFSKCNGVGVVGLCSTISDVSRKLYFNDWVCAFVWQSNYVSDVFPELLLQKPKWGVRVDGFWWDRSPYDTNRQKALLRMIKMTE